MRFLAYPTTFSALRAMRAHRQQCSGSGSCETFR
jgi:hypothetical protein